MKRVNTNHLAGNSSDPRIPSIRGLYLSGACAYFLAATFLHEHVSNLYSEIFHYFGRETMERSLLFISLIMGGAALLWSGANLWRRRETVFRIALLWALGLALAMGANTWLVVTNVELVHYPQYAILALLLAPVSPSYFTVLLACSAAGVFDELMQYVMFPKYTEYLDFNDFILNMAGAGLGIALHASFSAADGTLQRLKRIDARSAFAACAIILVLLGAGLTGHIVQHAPIKEGYPLIQNVSGKPAFVLSFRREQNYWTHADHGRIYHILRPLEGLGVMTGIFAAYAALFGGFRHGRGLRKSRNHEE